MFRETISERTEKREQEHLGNLMTRDPNKRSMRSFHWKPPGKDKRGRPNTWNDGYTVSNGKQGTTRGICIRKTSVEIMKSKTATRFIKPGR